MLPQTDMEETVYTEGLGAAVFQAAPWLSALLLSQKQCPHPGEKLLLPPESVAAIGHRGVTLAAFFPSTCCPNSQLPSFSVIALRTRSAWPWSQRKAHSAPRKHHA